MGIFSFLKRKKYNYENPEIAAEAQQRANEIKALKFKQRLLEHQRAVAREQYKNLQLEEEIAAYRGEEQESQGDSSFNVLLKDIIIPIAMRKFFPETPEAGQIATTFLNPPPTATTAKLSGNPTNAALPELSDEEIIEQLDAVPRKYAKFIKAAPDATIKAYLTKNFAYGEQTIDRAIYLMKNR
jgi:hypothetical protein